ncbi:ABC transporter substrate-binding protein [Aliidiomarina taiwanensis]|uniref:ABC transporter substrate-binding protein n=1 Tax=Aliidiomarina taiwanensis TaxID=946228 RepID=A0A432X1A5_9GAMM|nr:ABC transporter substrate-binding protein [Aliidiomarina taiwanensis]RUO39883.1 ABC transporter substrate-binding protein [Aliidiomarina taiwanensis]
MRRFIRLRLLALAVLLTAPYASAQAGQVHFYGWGGSPQVSTYMRWVQQELRAEGIQLRHNKVADIAEVVKQITAGHSNADLIWINGENFHALKAAGALQNIVDDIAAVAALNPQLQWQHDFGEPVTGLEVPWGVGQFNLLARAPVFSEESITAADLLQAAQRFPGRLSYPKPPDFHGTTFLKSLLLALQPEQAQVFQQPVQQVNAAALTAPLWRFLTELHPHLWQQGRSFPASAGEQVNYLAQGQLVMAVSFNPNDYKTLVRTGRLPTGIQRHRFRGGAITNTHYLAIPKGAKNPEMAKQVIEFLLSERAQLRKADPNRWGDPSVLAEAAEPLLPAAQEFHASWQRYLEQQWSARFQ